MDKPTTSPAEREAARMKASFAKLAAETQRRKEMKNMPRASTIASTKVAPAPIVETSNQSQPTPPIHNKEWPTCAKCGWTHNPQACFVTDKVALEKFLKVKPQEVKDKWARNVAGYNNRMAREAHKAAEHQAFLERDARRKKRRAEILAFEAGRAARKAEAIQPKTVEQKRAEHQRCVRKMIREGGGFGH